MSTLFGRFTEWMMRHRGKLPRWVNDLMASVARNPDGLIGRIASRLLAGGADVPATSVPDTPLRLYIGPTNYSGQGFAWARAIEREDPRVGARNVAIELPGTFGFPADTQVPIATVNASDAWADAEFASLARFTHVLVEAERPLLGRRFGRDLRAEITALEAEGLSVAYLCHGTDIRDPAAHARRTPWSPYPEDPRTALLAEDAAANLALLSAVRRPTFVSTPDLIDDVPWAIWCPVVIDVDRFRATPTTFSARPRVVHLSSSAVQKGSHLIADALAPDIASGAIDYALIDRVPAAEIPAVLAAADIVLDQFRLGSYGVAACEAMAAGRVVIGHVLPEVRERVHAATGMHLPIVEATPDTLAAVLADLIADPARAAEIAAAGPAFVDAVHSGAASARALLTNWILPD